MKKNIIDTSVIVYDPNFYKMFDNSEVILPIAVIDELDKLKKLPNDAGKNARVAIRFLDDLSYKGDISVGILTENNVLIKIDTTDYPNTFGDALYGDTRILACAYGITKQFPLDDITLVSRDFNLRVRFRALGLDAESYEKDKVIFSDLYDGVKTLVEPEIAEDLIHDGWINPKLYGFDFYPNQCIVFTDMAGNELVYAKASSPDKLKVIKPSYPWGLSPRNKEQTFAANLIADTNVPLITLVGKAGSGKTIITLATALEMVLHQKKYDKLVIYRPIQPMGNDVGYLPGPQPLDAKISTPYGWTTMGEIKVGDKVISRDGTQTEVLKIFPKGKKSVYRVMTSDGTSTECCEDHIWSVRKREGKITNKEYETVSTKEIINSLNKTDFFLPRNEAVHYNDEALPLPPYSLGAFLGDGSITDNHITLYTADQEIIDKVSSELESFDCNVVKSNTNKLSYRFCSKTQVGKAGSKFVKITNLYNNVEHVYQSIGAAAKVINMTPSSVSRNCNKNKPVSGFLFNYLDKKMTSSNPIIKEMIELGLYKVKSYDKFIPKKYLYSSIKNRISLLQGLMDTDGAIKNSGETSFTTTSKQLALDMIELVRSLGGRATLCSRDRIGKSNKTGNCVITAKRISYEFTISLPGNINCFSLNRKAKKHNINKKLKNIKIKSIEYVGEKEVQCIKVSNPEHLYLTDDFIVTHNTIEEKLAPWFQAIMDNFEVLFKTSSTSDKWRTNFEAIKKKDRIQFEALTYIRGRSIPNAIILIDETQNISKEEIKTILTRVGENSKIILTGDIYQIDNTSLDVSNNGLTYVIEKFKDSELAGHITFTQGERSKLASIAADIL